MAKSGGKNLWLILAIGIVAGIIIGIFLGQSLKVYGSPRIIGTEEVGGGGSVFYGNFKTFPVNNEDYGFSAEVFCQNRGYPKCVLKKGETLLTYYQSIDGSCTVKQADYRESNIGGCTINDGLLTPADRALPSLCRGGTADSVEPMSGDFNWIIFDEIVVCAR